MNILIADDSKLSRATLDSALRQLGHHVLQAHSGEDAIEKFRNNHPDLVILDVVMDGMSGFECATQIRALENKTWIPIIFLSSSLDDENIANGIDAGGDDYLTKPFSQIVLSAKIKAMQRIADMRQELVDLSEKLNILSRTDPLTGLDNRLQFDKKIKDSFSYAKRMQKSFAMFFIDIDHFKEVNDKFGHHIGDLLLIEASQRLKSSIRQYDFVARLGGDEFAIIIEDVENKNAVESILKKIIELGRAPFHLKNNEIFVSFSIGVAIYPQDGLDPQTLVKNADTAMYYVKKNERNDYQFYTGV